ncbi:hypothetical protein H4R35_006766, partial [Dimargaris xerosporica]
MEAAEIWRQPLHTILSAAESVLLDENGQPFRLPTAKAIVSSSGSAMATSWAATASSDGCVPDALSIGPRGSNPFGVRSISSSTTSSGHSSGTEGPLLPPPPPPLSTSELDSPRPHGMKRKATATLDPWGDGEVKAQRLTNALSSRLARSLSVSRNSPDLIDSGSSSAWSSDAMQCSPPRIAATRPISSITSSMAILKSSEEQMSTPTGQGDGLGSDPSAFVLKPIAKARSTSQTRAMAARESENGIHGLIPLIRDGNGHGNFEDREGSISDVETPMPSASSLIGATGTTTKPALRSDDGTAWLAALTELHGMPGQASGSFDVDQWLRQQAHAHSMSVVDFQHHCQQRLHSVKYCLDLLSHGSLPPSSSPASFPSSSSSGVGSGSGIMDYAMLRQTVLDLQRQCHWLGERGYRGLVQVFPDLGRHRDMLLSVVRYVHIREDMAVLVSTPIGMALQRIADTGTTLPDYFAQKHALYKDLLRQNGLEWRVRGYAIDDALFQRTQQWFLDLNTAYIRDLRRVLVLCNSSSAGFSSDDRLPSNMASSPLLRLELYPPENTAIHGDGNSVMFKRLLTVILRNVKTAARCVEFVGRVSASLVNDCLYLATEYTRLSMVQTTKPGLVHHRVDPALGSSSVPSLTVVPAGKSKGSSAPKVMYQFERVLSLLTCLRAIRDGETLIQLSPFPATNAMAFHSISVPASPTQAPHQHFSPTAVATSPFAASPTVSYSPTPFSPAPTAASHPTTAAALPVPADLVPEM